VFSSESLPPDLIRWWRPVRVKKTRQNKKPEIGFDSIKVELWRQAQLRFVEKR
jgi:hypothetical protein